jgi:FkbM family methyltransferase
MKVEHALLRASKLVAAARTPVYRRGILLNVFPSIEHTRALGGRTFATVVDVGANRGQFALFARKTFPTARVYLFEPLRNCGKLLNKLFGTDQAVAIHNVAIGPRDETKEINVAAQDDSSSLLPIGAEQSKIFGTVLRRREVVRILPLSKVIERTDIVAPALLKIDVQGFELEVLKGCDGLLDAFETIYVECSFIELYNGQAKAAKVIDFLHQRQFALGGVFNQCIDVRHGPVQADFLFRRR